MSEDRRCGQCQRYGCRGCACECHTPGPVDCRRCGGSGLVRMNPCPYCNGTGLERP
jgi:hypothetical protein